MESNVNGTVNMEDKYSVYMHYYITMLGLKHNFEIVDSSKSYALTGRGNPDKKVGGVFLYFLWKNMPILSYEEFDYEYWKIRM